MSNSILTKTIGTAVAATLSFAGISASANAQDRIIRSVEVQYADLDLTSEGGKEALQNRLRGAVRTVCGGYDSRNLRDTIDYRQCTGEARQSAKKATVTLLAAAAAGKPLETAMIIKR